MGYITISKKALEYNFSYFSKLAGGNEKMIVGLKDNAYGHGIEQVAKVLAGAGAKHCFVRSLQEAQLVEEYFDSVLILVEPSKIPLSEKIHTAVCSLELLREVPQHNSIELAVDTGMHRDGIMPTELAVALQIIEERKLKLKGIYTHFASADEPDNSFMKRQQQVFDECVAKARQLWNVPFRVHCANTAGISCIDAQKYDASRIGLGLYGYSEYCSEQEHLQQVMSLFAERISTRVLQKGDTVGYGSQAFVVPCDNFTVSNYNIGYGDGFFRLNEHKKGKIADGRQILGRVSMDSFSLEGDDKKICVFRDARHLAEVHQTIVYEIMTGLHAHIERILVE
ncbi:MAG: alanine racemase [Flavobacteriaceae bacterium]|nr:alanine racemase [Flavobacteriaceae bacterium]